MSYFYTAQSIYQAAKVLAGKTEFLACTYKGIEFHRCNNKKPEVFNKMNPTVNQAKKYIKSCLPKVKRAAPKKKAAKKSSKKKSTSSKKSTKKSKK